MLWGFAFPELRHIRNPWNDPPSPPTVCPGELHKERGGGGAGFSSQEHSIPAAQTRGDLSQGKRPKGTSSYPGAPTSSKTGAMEPCSIILSCTLSPQWALLTQMLKGLGGAGHCGKEVIKALEIILSSSSQFLRTSTLRIWTPGLSSCRGHLLQEDVPQPYPTELIPYNLGTVLPSQRPCTQQWQGAGF